MMGTTVVRIVLVFGGFFLGVQGVLGAEPIQQMPLPRPRIVITTRDIIANPQNYHFPRRVSFYDVWQNYGVDQYGKWRPLVIASPYGAYYRANLEPFPWVETHTWEFIPYVVD
jgi:hypothetical protein